MQQRAWAEPQRRKGREEGPGCNTERAEFTESTEKRNLFSVLSVCSVNSVLKLGPCYGSSGSEAEHVEVRVRECVEDDARAVRRELPFVLRDAKGESGAVG